MNLHRRHLTDGQRAAVAVEAKERVRLHGATAPGRPATPRSNSNEVFEPDHQAERERRSDVRAAKEVGVSSYAVRQAERVKEADPALFEKVRAGVVPLRGAVKEVERRELQELADEINQPDFDPVENADQVRQRGEFTRLCRDLAALPPPAQFIARHDGMLRPDHIELARAALDWLTEFINEWDARS